MSKKNIEFRFKDIKDRNPVLTGMQTSKQLFDLSQFKRFNKSELKVENCF